MSYIVTADNGSKPISQILGSDVWYLIDSGADIPVWISTLKYLEHSFPDVYQVPRLKAPVTGFGGTVISDVFIIPRVDITEDMYLLDVPVAISKLEGKPREFSMILPESVFYSCNIKRRYCNGCVQYQDIENLHEYRWIGYRPICKYHKDLDVNVMLGIQVRDNNYDIPTNSDVLLQELGI